MMVARDGVEPPTPAFSVRSTGLTTFSVNNLTHQECAIYCDHSVTSADVRLSVGVENIRDRRDNLGLAEIRPLPLQGSQGP